MFFRIRVRVRVKVRVGFKVSDVILTVVYECDVLSVFCLTRLVNVNRVEYVVLF